MTLQTTDVNSMNIGACGQPKAGLRGGQRVKSEGRM